MTLQGFVEDEIRRAKKELGGFRYIDTQGIVELNDKYYEVHLTIYDNNSINLALKLAKGEE